MQFPFSQFEEWFQMNEGSIRSDFFKFLRFESISTNPEHKEDCLQTAHFLVSYLETLEMQTELLENKGLPVVFAQSKTKDSYPIVLLYQHYDVQPVDPLDLWKTSPFNPTMLDGKVYARGSSDNKGQCFLTLTALKALKQLIPNLPLHIKVFIEGEEESGGKGTQQAIDENIEKLKADFVAVIDFDIPSQETPSLTMGYRGLLAVNIECTNASTDLHSGIHGGVALNANRILVELLSKLWDADGKVTIPHFYDRILPLTEEEKKQIDFSFDAEAYQKEFGVGAFCQEKGVSLREANWICPTLEINGIWGGYTGPGFKTVIPAKSFAKVSCRLVPDQDPEEIMKHFQEFVLQNTPKGADIKIKWHHGAKGYRSSFSSRVGKAAAKSMEEVFQKQPCRYTLCGGAVPIASELANASGGEVALFGFALDTDNVHAPNEHFHWECFKKGFMTVARMLFELSSEKKE